MKSGTWRVPSRRWGLWGGGAIRRQGHGGGHSLGRVGKGEGGTLDGILEESWSWAMED